MKICKKCSSSFEGVRCLACKKASDAAYHAANREKHREVAAAYYLANKKKSTEASASWRAANPEKAKAIQAKYRANNKSKTKAAILKWQQANPERVKANNAAWAANNQDSRRRYNHTYRARKLGNGGELSPDIEVKLFKLQRGKCACCRVDLTKVKQHMDHVIPVALGGPNEDWNMQLLCQPCNNRKSAKHPVDFMQERGFLI